MKHISMVSKRTCWLAIAAVTIGLAGIAQAESSMSGKIASGSAPPGGSTDQGFSNNKTDQPAMDGGAKQDSGSYSEIGSPPGTEKSLGSSKPGSSGMKPGAGSGSGSSGSAGSDRGTSSGSSASGSK